MSWFSLRELIPEIIAGLITAIILALAAKFGPRSLRRLTGLMLSGIGKLRRILSPKRLLGTQELSQGLRFLDSKLDENLDIVLKLMASMEDEITTLRYKVTGLEAKSNPKGPPSDGEQ